MDMNLIFKSKQFQMCTFYSLEGRGAVAEGRGQILWSDVCGTEQAGSTKTPNLSWGIRTAGSL